MWLVRKNLVLLAVELHKIPTHTPINGRTEDITSLSPEEFIIFVSRPQEVYAFGD
jgi:hypothetical protein